MNHYIKKIFGREILDSRGNPTIEAEVTLDSNHIARASVPSGASTGKDEACEIRDNDAKRYNGKGVTKAVLSINNEIALALKGLAVDNQAELDHIMCNLDGTPNKSRLGANAILAVSLAIARARAMALQLPLYASLDYVPPFKYLPTPLMNILNGGAHADNNIDIQEFMIVPIGAKSFSIALQMGSEIFHALKAILKTNKLSTAVGDEGGFAPSLLSNKHALDLLSEATVKAGFILEKDVVFALDVAASGLYNNNKYIFAGENLALNIDELIEYYANLVRQYPICSIEDGVDEGDWEGWKKLTLALSNKIQLVGDDIFVTHAHLLEKGIRENIANAILIKPNQVGTLTETLETINIAQQHNYATIISHRSGETADTFIADLAVASGAKQIKTGSLCRSDRIAKYNQLLRIEEATKLPYASKIKSFN
ncbi:MAG: phosphopyruvate hydratase [Legionellales bacterium RIFCSPHIGHO2_12_FULL_37_14]|nr:MAG: phosphopyruvate hydratase [Legionellales bacterium RIFCSPHIGHO2_12_FULL_37_14]